MAQTKWSQLRSKFNRSVRHLIEPSKNSNANTINNQTDCDDCNPKHIITQHTQSLHQTQDDMSHSANINQNQQNRLYQAVNRNLIRCNGDCGSQFAKLVEQIINEQITNTETNVIQYESTITIMFRYLNDPLRQSLLRLMRKRGLFNDSVYETYYKHLNDETFNVEDTQDVIIILHLFKALISGNHIDILQQIAFQTCRDPSWSLLEQISYGTLYQLEDKYNALKQTISMFEGDSKENHIVVATLQTKLQQINDEIHQEKNNVAGQKSLKEYFKRLQIVKLHPKYKQMQDQNSALNDLEILAIMLYCNEDTYCNKLHKSHYTKGADSCKWSNLFYHICSGIDKIWRIFHYKQRDNPQRLFSGSTARLTDDKKQQLPLNTVTSFTSLSAVAEGFANKGGMIIAIDGANKALAEGRLRGAEVSWISKYRECEYLILPTTFSNFKYMTEQQRIDKSWWIDDNYKLYVTSDVESLNMSSFVTNINSTFDPPMAWIPPNFPYYEDLRTTIDAIAAVMGNLIGHWRSIECPECKIDSRIFHFSGNWSDLSVQCPCCRCLLVKSGNIDDQNRVFKCYNLECKSDVIRVSDLKKVSIEEDGLHPNNGYVCTYCGEQQKKAHLHNFANNDAHIDMKADAILNTINQLLYLNCKHADGDIGEIDKNKYKDDLKRIIRFVHQPENINASLFDIIKQFPVIWRWITSIKNVKVMLDAYKDGYMELLDEENEKEKLTKIGSVIGNEIAKIKSPQEFLEKSRAIVNAMINPNNSEIDISSDSEHLEVYDQEGDVDTNSVDDGRVWYNCPGVGCGRRVWAYKGYEGNKCTNCLAKGLFSLFG